MSADTQTRVVFLVTTPISESIDRCLYELLQGIDGNRIRTQKIDWDDTSSPVSSIPTINPHLSFTRHFALGVMDRNDWDDPALTNLQRFHKASFWEHRGSIPGRQPRQGKPWKDEEIRQIKALQFYGWTEKPNDLITSEYSSILLQGWTYLPVWWNCQSFATRLAFLVVELETFRDRAAALARELHTEVVQSVISWRNLFFSKASMWAKYTLFGPWVVGVVSVVVFPLAVPVFGGAYAGGAFIGMAMDIGDTIFKAIDASRYKRFRANLEQLETRFPSLRQFHPSFDQQQPHRNRMAPQ